MQTSTAPSDRQPPNELSFSLDDWQKGYESLQEEHDYWIDEIEGQIPADLHGTLFRNGPGLLDIGGQPIHHPFDGDGMICAIAFNDGRAHFRNRFVRTAGFVAEQQANKILYRGVFGTQKPGGWLGNIFDLNFKNIANTQIIYWGKKLLALWEGGEPHRLDPKNLETLGIDYLNGLLEPGDTLAAHPRIDPACAQDNDAPRLVNFAIKPGLSTQISVYEFNLSGDCVAQQSRFVPGFAFIHDFAITPNYAIFFQNPIAFNPIPCALGFKGAGQCLAYKEGEPTQMLIIPRHDANAPMRTVPIEAGFVFHHANAYEQEGQLIVDSICYENFPKVDPNDDFRYTKFNTLPPGQLWRFRVDLDSETVQRQLISPRGCEFPVVNPAHVGRSYRYAYMGVTHAPTGNAPLQAIAKIDLQTQEFQVWSAAPRGFIGEPIFVPRESADSTDQEDNGWLLSLIFNAERDRSELIILDAQNVAAGPVARLALKHHVPYGLHGTFTPALFTD